jgi:RHS repeat-associated protein
MRGITSITFANAVTIEYDEIGRRLKLSATGQSDVTYTYDKNSRLKTVTKGAQSVTLAYDDAGRRAALTYPNGVVTSYGYDNADRLLTIAHVKTPTTIESLTYEYDAAGNRTSVTRANAAASLLPTALSQTEYNAANEQIRFNSVTPNLVYDSNGNLTSFTDSSGTTTYSWNVRNQLTTISGPGLTASFVYDGLGRRKSKTVNSVTTGYWYDGNDVLAELNGSTPTATYIRSLSMDEPFIRKGASDEFYQTDALGSALALTDAAGTSQVAYTYEPFGKTTVTGTTSNSLHYTGREDDGTGLYFYRARYYEPHLQRFIQEDPIQFRGGDINFYSYVTNAPLNFSDPLGLLTMQGPPHTPDENTYTYGEMRQYIDKPDVTPEQIADAKASIGAACGRGEDCTSHGGGPTATSGPDASAWKKIKDATGGTDQSGGGRYMCVGTPQCKVVSKCKTCRNGQEVYVKRDPPLPPSGTIQVGSTTTYFYRDPLRGWCNSREFKFGCRKCQ